MREFVFTITYDEGADLLMDVLADSPEAQSTGLVCATAADELWRLDRVSGPTAAVERATALLTDATYDPFSVSDRACEGERYSEVLERTEGTAVVYSHLDCISQCDAVALVSKRYLSGGVLFEVTRRGDTERWRVFMEDDEKVGMVYDTLGASLRDGLSFRFEHLEDVTESPVNPFASLTLRPEQRRVMEVAAERGYYATPRETTLDDLAAELDCPRSTVSYRLRRAEAELVGAFLSA